MLGGKKGDSSDKKRHRNLGDGTVTGSQTEMERTVRIQEMSLLGSSAQSQLVDLSTKSKVVLN